MTDAQIDDIIDSDPDLYLTNDELAEFKLARNDKNESDGNKTRVSLAEARSVVGRSDFTKVLADQRKERQKPAAASSLPQRAPLPSRR